MLAGDRRVAEREEAWMDDGQRKGREGSDEPITIDVPSQSRSTGKIRVCG